jgi:hypothetical protein
MWVKDDTNWCENKEEQGKVAEDPQNRWMK